MFKYALVGTKSLQPWVNIDLKNLPNTNPSFAGFYPSTNPSLAGYLPNTNKSRVQAITFTRSDSTLPVTFYSLNGARLWSWDNDRTECIQSGIHHIDLPAELKIFYHGKDIEQSNAEISLEFIRINKQSSKIKLNVPLSQEINSFSLNLVGKSDFFIIKITSECENLMIISGFVI